MRTATLGEVLYCRCYLNRKRERCVTIKSGCSFAWVPADSVGPAWPKVTWIIVDVMVVRNWRNGTLLPRYLLSRLGIEVVKVVDAEPGYELCPVLTVRLDHLRSYNDTDRFLYSVGGWMNPPY